MSKDAISIAITGASGAMYAIRLVECLLKADKIVYLMISSPAKVVIATETELNMPGRPAEIEAFFTEKFSQYWKTVCTSPNLSKPAGRRK